MRRASSRHGRRDLPPHDIDGSKTVELFNIRLRNQYDIASTRRRASSPMTPNRSGTSDAVGICPRASNHCVSAGDCGWRSGAGRWPEYYADSLPAAV